MENFSVYLLAITLWTLSPFWTSLTNWYVFPKLDLFSAFWPLRMEWKLVEFLNHSKLSYIHRKNSIVSDQKNNWIAYLFTTADWTSSPLYTFFETSYVASTKLAPGTECTIWLALNTVISVKIFYENYSNI